MISFKFNIIGTDHDILLVGVVRDAIPHSTNASDRCVVVVLFNRDPCFITVHNRKNLWSRASFGKWCRNWFPTGNASGGEWLWCHLPIPNILRVMTYWWILIYVKILTDHTIDPDQIQIKKFIGWRLFWGETFLYYHMTSVITRSVQVRYCAVGATTMHGFAADLIRNPTMSLVESRNYVK